VVLLVQVQEQVGSTIGRWIRWERLLSFLLVQICDEDVDEESHTLIATNGVLNHTVVYA
jgi:hypothetical protein